METVVSNLAQRPKRVKRNGRTFLVGQVISIVPGVLAGSKGALLYPHEEVAANLDAWNGMPIVVYHPTRNGINVSGRDPDVLEKQGVGAIYRTGFDSADHPKSDRPNYKLTHEYWIDEEDLRRVNKTLLEDIDAGKPIEVSTGLYTENIPEEGVYGGKPYNYVARNYKPDHLALLPDQTGACAVKDGCGINVNAGETPAQKLKRLMVQIAKNNIRMILTANSATTNVTPERACAIMGDKKLHTRNLTGKQKRLFGAQCQEHNREMLNKAWEDLDVPIEKACDIRRHGHARGHDLTEKQKGLFGARCGMRREKGKRKTRNYQRVDYMEYRANNDDVNPDADQQTGPARKLKGAIPGTRKTVFETTSNQGDPMNRKTRMVQWLTTNCDCWKVKGSQKVLNNLDEEQLRRLIANAETVLALQNDLGITVNAVGLPNYIREQARTLNATSLSLTGSPERRGGGAKSRKAMGQINEANMDDDEEDRAEDVQEDASDAAEEHGLQEDDGDDDAGKGGGGDGADAMKRRLMGMVNEFNEDELTSTRNIRRSLNKEITRLTQMRNSLGMANSQAGGNGMRQNANPRVTGNRADVNAWLQSAPEEVREVVQNSINIDRATREFIIDQLTANAQDEGSARQLRALYGRMKLKDLKTIAANQGISLQRGYDPNVQQMAEYFGAGGGPNGYTNNAYEDDALDLPTINAEEWREQAGMEEVA